MTNPRATPPALRMAIDYGPLLVFFFANVALPVDWCRGWVGRATQTFDPMTRLHALMVARIIVATGLFMVATLVAMVASRVKLGRVSPMLVIVSVPVFVFGGLTIYFADQRFIQMKPSFVYVALALLLAFGLATGRPLLQALLGTVYPGLSAAGWRRLTVNWAVFFALLAVANEIARQVLTFDQWVFFKFPGCTIATVLFAVANVPMLMRHGLTVGDEAAAAVEQLPPE